MARRFLYQRLAAPISADAAPPPTDQPPSAVSQPLRNHAAVRMAQALVAASQFFFAGIEADAAPPPTWQPQSVTAQPAPAPIRAAVYLPAYVGPATPFGPSEAQHLIQNATPARRTDRRHLYPTIVVPIAEDVPPPPDIRVFQQEPQIPVRRPDRRNLYPTLAAPITPSACAGGVTKPGATVIFQNDACALNGLYYNGSDLVLPPGDLIDLATNTTSYKAPSSIQNGDGVGTEVTTLTLLSTRLNFDNTKTYLVSAVGASNRWTKFGTKVQGASGKPSGKDGVVLDLGAQVTFRGNVQIYGSVIRNKAAGAINFFLGSQGLTAELINCIIEATSGAGNVVLGQPTGRFQTIYNVDVLLGGSGSLTLLSTDSAERITVAAGPTSNYCMNTPGPFTAKDMVFIGTPLIGDIRLFTAPSPSHLINPTWTGNAVTVTMVAVEPLREWWDFDVLCFHPETAAAVSGIPIDVLDKNGVVVFSGVSDVYGRIVFGTGLFANTIMVGQFEGVGVTVFNSMGPFTVRVNQTGAPHPDYFGYSYEFNWPYRDLPSSFGRQHSRVLELIDLVPKSGDGKEEWRASLA